MLQFNIEWRLFYPVLFQTSSWYYRVAAIAPFWAYSDEYLMQSLEDDFPEATTKVYYHEYKKSFDADAVTTEVLERAKQDVADHGESSCTKIKVLCFTAWCIIALYPPR